MSARHLRAARLRSRGLPARLPEGERLLWQGSPNALALLRRAFHVRLVAVYFATILVLAAASAISHGASSHEVAVALLHRAGLAGVPFALMALYAWAVQRSTTYSITTRRVVVSCGIALPVTFNLPFARIEAADVRMYSGGVGDISLRLLAGEQLSYFVMWPHARPWRMARTEPMLRCVPAAQGASAILARALADHAAQSPQVLAPVRQAGRSLAPAGLQPETAAA